MKGVLTMRKTPINQSDPFVWPGYALLVVGCFASLLIVRGDLRLALLPAAVVFGWAQVGGL